MYVSVFSPGYFGVAGCYAFLKVRCSARCALLYMCTPSAAQMQTRHTLNGHVAMLSRMRNKTRAFCVQYLVDLVVMAKHSLPSDATCSTAKHCKSGVDLKWKEEFFVA